MVTRRSLLVSGIAAATGTLATPARSVGPQRVLFGALTLPGMGGLPKPASASTLIDPAPKGSLNDLFEITASAFVIPKAKLPMGEETSLLGELIFDSGDVWQVYVVPEAYSCATGELGAILKAAPDLDGKTILGRHLADLCGSQPGSKVVFENILTTASHADFVSAKPASYGLRITTEGEFGDDGTLTRASTDKRSNMRRAEFGHAGLIKFEHITVSDSFVPQSDFYAANRLWTWTKGKSGRSQMIIADCDFSNSNSTDFETLVNNNKIYFSGKADAPVGNTVVLYDKSGSNLQNVSGIAEDGSFTLALRRKAPRSNSYSILQMRPISGVNGSTITTRNKKNQSLLKKDDPYLEFIIIKTVQIIGAIGQFGGIEQLPDLKVEGSKFIFCGRGITGTFNSLIVKNCVFDNNYADHISIGVTGNERVMDIMNNRFFRAGGAPGDLLNPHVDAIQFNASPMVKSNSVAYRVIGNIMWLKGGRSYHAQGIFIEGANRSDPAAQIRILVEIKHNIIMTRAGAGIYVVRPAPKSVISGNTVLQDLHPAPPNNTVVGISTKYYKSNAGASKPNAAADDGVAVEYNIAPYVTFAELTPDGVRDLNLKNKLFGRAVTANGPLSYSRVLSGPSFDSNKIGDPAKIGDIDFLLAAVTPKPGLLTAPNDIKIGANRGYYNYDTGEESADVPY